VVLLVVPDVGAFEHEQTIEAAMTRAGISFMSVSWLLVCLVVAS
jgi:hypothetical protein